MKKTIQLSLLMSCLLLLNAGAGYGQSGQAGEDILLKDYHPLSIYKVPVTNIAKAAYPVTDLHSHDYAESQEDIDKWIRTMDSAGIARTVILTYSTGSRFDSIVDKYKKYPGRFLFYCGFDYTGFGQPGWDKKAVAELERCYRKGARGIGELGDKGEGELYSKPTPGKGIHIDNPALKPLLDKCAALKIPVIIHVAEDQWMYEKPDKYNDGMNNAAKWHVNMNVPGKLGHDELIASLEKAVGEHPDLTFVACHLANCCSDLAYFSKVLDRHPNLYADIAARYSEFAPIPRYTAAFMEKYQDRLVYGTDMGMDGVMYRATFRILESKDEHFYEYTMSDYHWALYGLNLSKETLKKIYQTNAQKIISQP